MVNSSDSRRASRIGWACSLSLVASLGADSDGLGAQVRLPAQPALSPKAEVALMRTPREICVRTGEPPGETVVGVQAPLVRYLLEELIAQRLENSQLNVALADAKAQRAEIERTAREREAALAAWIFGLHDELAQREAQVADATAAQASGARLLEEARAAEASARARRQLAAMKNELKEQNRQMAILRSVAEDLAQRLGATEAELMRRDAENEQLAAELGALGVTTHSARVMARGNLAAIEDQMDTLPERPEAADPLSATSIDLFPAMAHPKPRLRAGEVEAWALVSDTVADGGPAPGEAHGAIKDAVWVQASLRDVAVRDWEPTIDTSPIAAPESLEIPDIMSTDALVPTPSILQIPSPNERGPTGLDEAAARLADGLRATREEAMLQQQEQVFTVDVEKRAFASSAEEAMPLDPALEIRLLTAKSELVGESKGQIRFFPDGSSTGGQIELGRLGDRAAVNVRWSTGAVTLER